MSATNAAFCLGGIHHICLSHGFSSFFSTLGAPSHARQRSHIPIAPSARRIQVSVQCSCPVGGSLQRQRYQMGFSHTIQRLRHLAGFAPSFAIQAAPRPPSPTGLVCAPYARSVGSHPRRHPIARPVSSRPNCATNACARRIRHAERLPRITMRMTSSFIVAEVDLWIWSCPSASTGAVMFLP